MATANTQTVLATFSKDKDKDKNLIVSYVDVDGTVVTNQRVHLPTRLIHEALTEEQAAIARYTYRHAGHYLEPTYEQWEAGFLRERFLMKELMHWFRVACILQNRRATGKRAEKIIADVCARTFSTQSKPIIGDPTDAELLEYLQDAYREAGIDPDAPADKYP